VCHRDVKSLNFLVDCQLTAKLADLELGTANTSVKPTFPIAHSVRTWVASKLFPAPEPRTNPNRASMARLSAYRSTMSGHEADSIGSTGASDVKKSEAIVVLPHWMAPEVLENVSSYRQSSDVFSFGVVLWEMLSRKLPYEGIEDLAAIRRLIIDGKRLELESVFGDKGVDERMRILINSMWEHDPSKRPTMEGKWGRGRTMLMWSHSWLFYGLLL
jgi:serine/threonine protein kinase